MEIGKMESFSHSVTNDRFSFVKANPKIIPNELDIKKCVERRECPIVEGRTADVVRVRYECGKRK